MLKPICNTSKGERVFIECLGCSCEDACRLQELGCVEGANGEVVSSHSRVILKIGETKLAISEALARTILVNTP